MKKSCILLLVAIFLPMTSTANAASFERKNELIRRDSAPNFIDLELKPARRDVISIIKLERVTASNPSAAEVEAQRGKAIVEYRRHTTGIRLRGLDEKVDYCIRATILFNDDYKPRASLDKQDFLLENRTEWLCTGTTPGLQQEINPEDENREELVRFRDDLLWYHIDISRKSLRKKVGLIFREGYLLDLMIMNAGQVEITGPIATRVACKLSTDRRAQGVIAPVLHNNIDPGQVMKFRAFVTQDMLRMCDFDLRAEILRSDEVEDNNIYDFSVKRDDLGNYQTIR